MTVSVLCSTPLKSIQIMQVLASDVFSPPEQHSSVGSLPLGSAASNIVKSQMSRIRGTNRAHTAVPSHSSTLLASKSVLSRSSQSQMASIVLIALGKLPFYEYAWSVLIYVNF